MSIFEKVLRNAGIGSVRIEILPEQLQFGPKQEIRGLIGIYGGLLPQYIHQVRLGLTTSVLVDEEEVKTTWATYPLSVHLEVAPHTFYPVPFSWVLPEDLPMSTGNIAWELDAAVNVRYESQPLAVEVLPHPIVAAVNDSFEQLGFQIFNSCISAIQEATYQRLPYAQQFEWRPEEGEFAGKLEQVLVTVLPKSDLITFYMEIDQPNLLLESSEEAHLSDEAIRFTVHPDDLQQPGYITAQLDALLRRYAK